MKAVRLSKPIHFSNGAADQCRRALATFAVVLQRIWAEVGSVCVVVLIWLPTGLVG
ncbi:hypothetical protein ABIE44_003100 [Marmoricola sp. OAE513]